MFIETFMSNIPKWEEFEYAFEKVGPRVYRATHKVTGDVVTFAEGADISEELFNQLELFKRTPEEGLGEKIPTATINDGTDTLINQYEILLAGCIRARMIASGRNPDNGNVSALLDWLESTDFFTAPASTQYHEAHVRGLVMHTLRVYNKMCDMWQVPDFADVAIHSAALVALLHDWCKIGLYEQYNRNVKNDDTGKWEQVLAFRHSENNAIGSFGHGVTSLFLAGRFFRLSNEEALAIRWHMGEYNVADNEMNDLHRSNEMYPMVQMIQFADRLSITRYMK